MEILKVGIYGTGKVALSFGRLLLDKGFDVGYCGRNVQGVRGYADGIGARVFDSPSDLVAWCDAVGFVVSDSVIAEVSAAVSKNSSVSDKLAFHMSGALAADELAEGFLARFSLHPLRAFARIESDISDTVFALEIHEGTGSPHAEGIDRFAERLGRVIKLNPADKPLYHASAVMASNLIVPVIDAAYSLLRNIGISDENLLWQLIDTAVSNMKNLGVGNALTGPIARGDSRVVRLHLETMSEHGLLPELAMYTALSRWALKISGAPEEKKFEIEAVLQEYERGENEQVYDR